jgi:hypothetical protein
MPWFELHRGGRKAGEVQVLGREALLGRARSSDVVVEDPRVSRHHARLLVDEHLREELAEFVLPPRRSKLSNDPRKRLVTK